MDESRANTDQDAEGGGEVEPVEISWIGEVLGRAAGLTNVAAVFGQPYKAGDKTLIPVATVRHMQGFGGGSGEGGAAGAAGAGSRKPGRGAGSGGGGGSISTARPVAVIEVSEGKVRIEAIADVLPLAIGGMLLAGWNVYWITKTVRERGKSRVRSAD